MTSKYDNAPLLEDLAFKALRVDGTGPYQPFLWPLPTQNGNGSWTPGEWTERIHGRLVICKRGYHFFQWRTASHWISSSDCRLFVLEPKSKCKVLASDRLVSVGVYESEPDKYATTSARLVQEIPWNTFYATPDFSARWGSAKYRGIATRREVVRRLRKAGVLVQ